MSLEFKLKSIKYSNKEYREGLIRINEGNKEVEVLYRKTRLFRSSWETITRLTYDAQTVISVSGTMATIDDLYMEAESIQDSETICNLISKPRYEQEALLRATQKRVEKVLQQVEEPTRRFLTLRTKTLGFISDLKTTPRQALLQSSSMLPEVTEDPISEMLQIYSERLQRALEEIQAVLDSVDEGIDRALIDKIYAFVYGIGVIQDAIFKGDEAYLETGLGLLSQVCSKDLKAIDFRGVPLDEVTNRLLDQSFGYLRQAVLSS